MPIFHHTFFFSWRRAYSWVEQFWREGPDRGEALATALELASARFQILGQGATCYRVRVCQDRLRFGCISSGVAGTPRAQLALPPIEGLEAKLTSSASQKHWRNYCLRGLPAEAFVQIGTRWLLSPVWKPAVDTWLALLVNGRYLLQVEVATGPVYPIATMTQYALADADIYGLPLDEDAIPAPAAIVATVLNDVPSATGDLVAIHGVKTAPNTLANRRRVNGVHPVALQAGPVVYWLGSLEGIDATEDGTLELRARSFLPITNWVYKRRVAHKCGPFKEEGETLRAEPVPPAVIEQAGPPRFPPLIVLGGGPAAHEYRTLREIAVEVFKGYTEPTTPNDPLVGIARRSNTTALEYAVFIGGVDLHIEKPPWQQYANGLASLLGAPDDFTTWVRGIIEEITEDGCILHLFGHSMGGMAAQWMTSIFPDLGSRRIKTLIGLGTAWIVTAASVLPFEGAPSRRLFMVQNDPVPYLGPAGFAFSARIALDIYTRTPQDELSIVLAQLVIPWGQTRLLPGPDLPLTELVGRHNCYPDLPTCDQYSWNGISIADLPPHFDTLITGEVRRFYYPPLP